MKLPLWIASAVFAPLAAIMAAPSHASMADNAGPSFSCAAARTTTENAICADPDLAAMDREMAMLFAQSRTSALGHGPSNELEAQRAALNDMRSCRSAAGDRLLAQCLKAVYARRNFELATALLMRAPATALPILRRIDGGFAPILEAVAIWAREPVDSRWDAAERAESRRRIATLLAPYLAALKTNENQSFGWSILSQPGAQSPSVTRIDDLFLSDQHFAAFLNVLGPYLPDEGSTGVSLRDLPCAAIVRHPALLNATDAIFGSTMDNFGFRTDCDRTLPPVPGLTALDRKIMSSWPECEGTIRFAAYRAYSLAVDAARLGQFAPASQSAPDTPRGISAADIAKARTELASHYSIHYGKSAPAAAAAARTAIARILSTAHGCGT